MNLPNKLTILRIIMTPFFIAAFYLPMRYANLVAAAIFIAAYITDILDGDYARRHNLVTTFGKLMDPIADKMITSSALIMLVSQGSLSPVIAIVMILREFIISGFRLVSASSGVVIAANSLGKLKTVTQCIAIILVLVHDPIIIWLGFALDTVFVWLALAFTVWSGADYILRNRKAIEFK